MLTTTRQWRIREQRQEEERGRETQSAQVQRGATPTLPCSPGSLPSPPAVSLPLALVRTVARSTRRSHARTDKGQQAGEREATRAVPAWADGPWRRASGRGSREERGTKATVRREEERRSVREEGCSGRSGDGGVTARARSRLRGCDERAALGEDR
jgi:hypothetical protein